jgi:hypothetical protein
MVQPMKMLVCIIGNLRGGDRPVASLKKHILDPFHADLALCIGSCEDHPYKQIAKYVWEFDEPEDWSAIWDEVGTDWRKIERDLHSGTWGGIGEAKGSGAVIFAFRYMLKRYLQENELLSDYDTFVITRSDHIYVNDKMPISPGVHVPTGQDHGGITDRHMVVDASRVIQVLSILEYINDELPVIGDKNPEKVLKDFYAYLGLTINRYRRNMFCVARKNEQTRWRGPTKHFEGDLYFKYPAEYDEAQGNLRHRLRCLWDVFVRLYLRIRGQR